MKFEIIDKYTGKITMETVTVKKMHNNNINMSNYFKCCLLTSVIFCYLFGNILLYFILHLVFSNSLLLKGLVSHLLGKWVGVFFLREKKSVSFSAL